MDNKIELKREREKCTVSLMISIYCRKKHHSKGVLCDECKALNDYAILRSDRCPFMKAKPSALTAGYIAISQKCVRKSVRLCAFQVRE